MHPRALIDGLLRFARNDRLRASFELLTEIVAGCTLVCAAFSIPGRWPFQLNAGSPSPRHQIA
jgi:hypothetical protein